MQALLTYISLLPRVACEREAVQYEVLQELICL